MTEKVELYNGDWRYTDVASAIDRKVNEALRPIFKEYIELGCSPREISHVMSAAVIDLELISVLDWDDDKRKNVKS